MTWIVYSIMDRRQSLIGLIAVAAIVACGDPAAPDPPDEVPVRTILVHRFQSGGNMLLRSDGEPGGAFTLPGGANLIPIASASRGQTFAFEHGNAIVVGSLSQPTRLDTIIAPRPTTYVLASFSADERLVGMVSLQPTRSLLTYDRASDRIDTLPLGDAPTPALPPVYSPDGTRVATLAFNGLSVLVTLWTVGDRTRAVTDKLSVGTAIRPPVFGWPQWTDDGLMIALLHLGFDDPDTLVVALVDPDDPNAPMVERLRAVMAPVSDERPGLIMGDNATYALSADGRAIVLAADPGTASGEVTLRQALYLVTEGVGRVQLLFDDPAVYPAYPLFVN
ncbi:MAG TPA: hypothetical protein VGA37_01340 [Gemmatimonadales bacterium]